MKKKFTLTERVILEVLASSSKNFEDLSSATNLKDSVLLNSLHLLMLKRIITCDHWSYSIDSEYVKNNLSGITSYQDNILELKELIGSAIEYSIEQADNSFKMRKSSISKEDFSIIKGLLHNIETIISSPKKNKNDPNEKIVFYWGHGNYQQIINKAIS